MLDGSPYHTDIPIHRRYPLIRILLEQFTGDEFLQRKHDAIFAADADGGAAVFHGFDSVFDLEIAAVGGEDGVGEIVACAY